MGNVDVVVVGGGAAGLMCALTAGRRGRRVLVLERSNRCGKKILMSGGGRCNFTNLHVTPERFLGANPHFHKSALARYTQWDFIALVDAHGIPWHEKELGQLFCDDSSKRILAMLLEECARTGVSIETGSEVERIRPRAGGFSLATSLGAVECESLVIASGGLSIPKMGATGFGHRIARQFGHEVIEPRAGLVPFTLPPETLDQYRELKGVSQEVTARCNGQAFRAGMLFTHRGLSGPAMLQASSYWQPGDEVEIDLLPDTPADAWLLERKTGRARAEVPGVLAERMPRRLAQRLCDMASVQGPMARQRDSELKAFGHGLNHWSVQPAGTEGYATAEVTLGGVGTEEISSRTMESRRVPGVYFIGEVLDVTGHLGGFNFQWAWASGHAAGEVV